MTRERLEFIEATRGGSAWLWAGGLFWLAAGVAGWIGDEAQWTRLYLFGGFCVPVVGWLIAKRQGATIPRSEMVPLVAIASAITPFCFPLLLLLDRRDPSLIPVALTTIDGAHLLILMWVQLDYAYFLAAVAKAVIGAVFGFALLGHAPAGVGVASALVSFVAAWSAAGDARRASTLYGAGAPPV